MNELLYLVPLAVIATSLLTKLAILKFPKLGIVGIDLHKDGKPQVPGSGGIAIAGAFTLVMLLKYFLNPSTATLIILLAFLASAAIGLFDDIFGFPPKSKLLLVSCGAIPLLWLVDWRIIPVVLVFVLVAMASNWTNMLAGFNGIEIGTGMIAIFFLASSSNNPASNTLMVYSACLLAFLLFNKYPARILPGDVGSLPIGTMMVAAYLIGAPLLNLAILLLPYAVDTCLKYFSVGFMNRTEHQPTGVKNGVLIPRGKYLSLIKVMMKLGLRREWQVAGAIWGIELALGVVTLIL